MPLAPTVGTHTLICVLLGKQENLCKNFAPNIT